jgi:hypothetical protein
MMDIVRRAFDMAVRVQQFFAKARRFYYLVMLFGCRCPRCKGSLDMVGEGRCRCNACTYEFDPTVAFQRCWSCGGTPVLRVRRYGCRNCGKDITSRFVFDGTAFDAGYFRRKMAESRQRKKELRQRVREMLAECRSSPLALEAVNLDSIPGLVDALNSLTNGLGAYMPLEVKSQFDLDRYQTHIRSCLADEPVQLRDIPPLIEDLRLDLIWRFVAAVFLTHAGSVDICQQGETLWVMKRDDREGQGIPGEAEGVDGFKGSFGRAQAW